MKKAFLWLLLMSSSTAVVFGQDRTSALGDLCARLGDDGRHSVLIALLRTADAQDKSLSALFGGGPHTVLAPSDDAFAKLPISALAVLRKDKSRLHEFLFAHIVAGKVMIADMLVPVKGDPSKTLFELKSMGGGSIRIVSDGQTRKRHPSVNGSARIGQSDLLFSGGVIHDLDAVLVPHPGGAN